MDNLASKLQKAFFCRTCFPHMFSRERDCFLFSASGEDLPGIKQVSGSMENFSEYSDSCFNPQTCLMMSVQKPVIHLGPPSF